MDFQYIKSDCESFGTLTIRFGKYVWSQKTFYVHLHNPSFSSVKSNVGHIVLLDFHLSGLCYENWRLLLFICLLHNEALWCIKYVKKTTKRTYNFLVDKNTKHRDIVVMFFVETV